MDMSQSFILLFSTRGFITVNFIEESEALSQSQGDNDDDVLFSFFRALKKLILI